MAKKSTLEKLEEAMELMKQAESLVKEAKKENESLSDYYGYSLDIIAQELNQFSDNSKGYIGRNKCLEDIINAEGENWDN